MMPYWKKACKTTSEEGVHLIPRHTLGSRGLLRLRSKNWVYKHRY